MSLESAIQNLADELKRYNDGATSPKQPVANSQVAEVNHEVPKAAAKKTAPKVVAEKPAPVALTCAEVQQEGIAFISKRDRDAFINILKASGVPSVENNGKQVYKVTTVADKPEILAKISAAMKEALESDPTA